MNLIKSAIDGAIADAIAEHPKYFTPRGLEHARTVILRKVMAALRGDTDKPDDAPAQVASTPAGPMSADPDSREATAYLVLRQAAGAGPPFRMGDGRISIPAAALQGDALAFADAPPASAWPLICDRQQIAAWQEFFRETLPGLPRKPIMVTEGASVGIRVPWPWPPAKTGKTYDPNEDAA